MIKIKGGMMIPASIQLLLDSELEKSMREIRTRKCPEEPDYVLAILKAIKRYFDANGDKLGVKCGFGYIHQSPKVSFLHDNISCVCEAGDMLILAKKGSTYNSIILQSKLCARNEESIKLKALDYQLFLYTNWPRMRIMDKRVRRHYEIYPKMPMSGAQYLLLRTGTECLSVVSPPHRIMDFDAIRFSTMLCGFLRWQTGRPISSRTDRNHDEWSRFVWDIVRVASESLFTRNNSYVGTCTGHRLKGNFFRRVMQLSGEALDATHCNADPGSRGMKILAFEISK